MASLRACGHTFGWRMPPKKNAKEATITEGTVDEMHDDLGRLVALLEVHRLNRFLGWSRAANTCALGPTEPCPLRGYHRDLGSDPQLTLSRSVACPFNCGHYLGSEPSCLALRRRVESEMAFMHRTAADLANRGGDQAQASDGPLLCRQRESEAQRLGCGNDRADVSRAPSTLRRGDAYSIGGPLVAGLAVEQLVSSVQWLKCERLTLSATSRPRSETMYSLRCRLTRRANLRRWSCVSC